MFNFANWIENITNINLSPETMIFIALGVAIVTLFLLFLVVIVNAKKKPEKDLDQKIEQAFDEAVTKEEKPVIEASIQPEEIAEPVLEKHEPVFQTIVEETGMGVPDFKNPMIEADHSATMGLNDVVAAINETEFAKLEEEAGLQTPELEEVSEVITADLIEETILTEEESNELSFNYDDKPFELIDEESLVKPPLPQIFSSVYLEPRERELAMTKSMPVVDVEEEQEIAPLPSWPFIEEKADTPDFSALSKSFAEEPVIKEVEEEPALEPDAPTLTADIIRERLMQLQNVKEEVKIIDESEELDNILKQVGLNEDENQELNKEEGTSFYR